MSSNKPNSKLMARSRRDNRAGWLMASPWILGFCFFMLIPVIVSVFLSLTNYSLLSAPEFIGLDNYKKMLFNDPNVWHSMGITILYAVVNVPLTLALSFILALLINRKIRGVSLFRTIFYSVANHFSAEQGCDSHDRDLFHSRTLECVYGAPYLSQYHGEVHCNLGIKLL